MLSGGGGRDEAKEAAQAFGLPAEVIEDDVADLDIWPDHAAAVSVFAALLTQWRLAPMGGVTGLDYAAIPPTLELMGMARDAWPDIFDSLRVLENEAIKVLNK